MSAYDQVRITKLVLKGEKPKKSKKRKDRKERTDHETEKKQVDEDALKYGGWWQAKSVSEITGTIAFEFGIRSFLRALDNGLFILGQPHPYGECPDPEEIFTAFSAGDCKVSFKSGYGKYLRVEKDGVITGRSEAVGILEQWEPVFENDRMALLAHSGCFMSIDPEDDACVALRKKVTENEICTIRCNAQRDADDDVTKEDKGDLTEIERNYVQKFQNKKLRISKYNVKALESAQKEGALREALLDRRSKMKADRYCK